MPRRILHNEQRARERMRWILPPSRTQPATSYQIWLLSFFRVAVEPPASEENWSARHSTMSLCQSLLCPGASCSRGHIGDGCRFLF